MRDEGILDSNAQRLGLLAALNALLQHHMKERMRLWLNIEERQRGRDLLP